MNAALQIEDEKHKSTMKILTVKHFVVFLKQHEKLVIDNTESTMQTLL